MKRLLFLCCWWLSLPLAAQTTTSPAKLTLKGKQSHLAVFVVDFITNRLEGGHLQHLPKAPTDSLQLLTDYKAPADFGAITFQHQPSEQLVFKGTILWNGTGEIQHPVRFLPPERFKTASRKIEKPLSYQYYAPDDVLEGLLKTPERLVEQVTASTTNKHYIAIFRQINAVDDFYGRIWQPISQLQIVKQLVKKKCRVGLYLYTPTVGLLDLAKAKWVIFLYVD